MQQQIYEKLSSLEELTELLSKYQNAPAIFFQMVPREAVDEVFPRLVCGIKEEINMKHDFLGELEIRIEESAEMESKADLIQKILKRKLRNSFFFDEEQFFGIQEGTVEDFIPKENEILRTNICRFPLMAFEKSETLESKPVTALYQWIQEIIPQMKVIQRDGMENGWQADQQHPAFYLRLESIKPGNYGDNWQAAWIQAGIRVFIMTEAIKRVSLIQTISEKLLQTKKLVMSDGGTLLIHRVEYNDTMHPLKNRQFFVECQYGIVREEEETKTVQGISMKTQENNHKFRR